MRKCLSAILVFALFITACRKDDEISSPLSPVSGSGKQAVANTSTFKALGYTSKNWMSFIPGNTPLSMISIPGTHDSGALIEPVWGTSQCQTLPVSAQLDAGVRFLDIRCRHFHNAFTIHHGLVYQKMNFTDVINACTNFLKKNPSETIIMSVKSEHTSEGNTRSYEDTFYSYVNSNPSLWYLSNSIPEIGAVRGKIVLLRRFSAISPSCGINATSWRDNASFTVDNGYVSIRVQDQYNWKGKFIGDGDYTGKWTAIKTLFSEAVSNTNSGRLILNFTSAVSQIPVSFWSNTTVPNIRYINNYIAPLNASYFAKRPKGHFGIVIMDFINSSISNAVYTTNFY